MKLGTAEEEYNKNPDLNKEDINNLKKWHETRSDLPELNERELIIFHHSCLYNIEDTKQCIENYFKLRSKNPQFFSNRDPQTDQIKKLNFITGYYVLNGQTPEGYRVIMCRMINTSASAYNFNDAIKMYTMVADAVFNSQGSCNGDIIIFDMTGITFGFLPKLSVSSFKNTLEYVQEALPVRLKAIHLINAIPFIDIVMNMMTPFMKKELLDMFHVSTSTDVLNTLIPPEMLPSDYGGKGLSLAKLHEQTIDLINDQRQFYLDDEKRRMSKQSLKNQDKKKQNGVDISSGFRKLDLD